MFTTLSGRDVSRFSFGCMQFGGGADEAASEAMYRACREAGISFFDTAYGYTNGQSERFLGRFIAADRDDVFVASKCAYTGADAGSIAAQVEESRQRLGIDVIDLLYLHRWDDDVPLEETLGAVEKVVSSGHARHVGVSNYASWQVMKARQMARDLGFDIVALQPMYNLVKRQVEVELLPMAQSEGFALCPYSPLGGGLLTGKYLEGGAGRLLEDERYATRYAPDWMTAAAAGLVKMASELGMSPATLAVAWVAKHAGVYGPIISGRSADQLAPSLQALTFELDDETYARLTALSPTPPPATDRLEEV